jgi:hypothetical protein
MKKRKIKKKLSKPRTAELDAPAKFMEESSKEVADDLDPLGLMPQAPLASGQHRD